MVERGTIFVLLLGLLTLVACKNPESLEKVKIPDGPTFAPAGFSTAGIDRETMDLLLNSGDHIDYIFNSLPLSMNQDGQQAIFQDLRFASNQAMPGIPSTCVPLARKIYLGQGEILMESDIYFSENCLFQIYIKDEKPLFGNMLSEEGITFYKNLLIEARRTMPEEMRNSYIIPSGI